MGKKLRQPLERGLRRGAHVCLVPGPLSGAATECDFKGDGHTAAACQGPGVSPYSGPSLPQRGDAP